MAPPEKDPEQSRSALPREPLTGFEVAIAIHKIKWQLDVISGKLEKAESNDERFKVMETHFTTVKWFCAAAIVAALGALFAVIGMRMSAHISDTPTTLQGR